MTRIQFGLSLLTALVAVLLRRLAGRAAPAAWNLGQEVLERAMRQNGLKLMSLPPETARTRSGSLQQSDRPPRGVKFQTVRLAGRDALSAIPFGVEPAFDILYFHGGGYCLGSPDTYRGHLGRLALATGARVTAPAYRLAPEHRFPAAVDDALAAYRAIVEERGANRLVVAGDSAGGALALTSLIGARDQGLPLAAGAILLSPWVDLSATTGSIVTNGATDWGDRAYLAYWSNLYLGDADASDPGASPGRAQLRGLPPLRVLIGGAELLRDQTAELVAAAKAAGVDAELETWPQMVHAFWMLGPAFPANATLARVRTWSHELVNAR